MSRTMPKKGDSITIHAVESVSEPGTYKIMPGQARLHCLGEGCIEVMFFLSREAAHRSSQDASIPTRVVSFTLTRTG